MENSLIALLPALLVSAKTVNAPSAPMTGRKDLSPLEANDLIILVVGTLVPYYDI